jgi:hypothetical protein
MATMAEAIRHNRVRTGRYKRAELTLRRIRQRIFDYEDEGNGKDIKAARVMATCQRILAPLWQQQRKNAEDRKLQATPSAFECGAYYAR